MKRLFTGVICALACSASVSHVYAQAGGRAIPGRYIVQLREGADPVQVVRQHGAAPDFIYRHAINGFAGNIPPGLVKALAEDANVLAIAPDREVSLFAAKGKPQPPEAQTLPAGVERVGAPSAWLSFTGANVGVAVVDTGIDFLHRDLGNVSSVSFSAFSDITAQDDNGHGTHVAGIIGATDNTVDVIGVAPNATVYAVKVLNSAGSGSDSTVIAGLNWVLEANQTGAAVPAIRVVNMSVGRLKRAEDGDNPPSRAAIQALSSAGITVVVAAGNDRSVEVKDMVPASVPEVLAVASTTAMDGTAPRRYSQFQIKTDTASSFTTDGQYDSVTGVGVTISAPGDEREDISNGGFVSSVGILSTQLGGGLVRMSGTSMASPHAAGVVALMYEKDPLATPEVVRARLRATAAGVGSAPLHSPVSGYTFDGEHEGILNAPGALAD